MKSVLCFVAVLVLCVFVVELEAQDKKKCPVSACNDKIWDPLCAGKPNAKPTDKPVEFKNHCLMVTHNCEKNETLQQLYKGHCKNATSTTPKPK